MKKFEEKKFTIPPLKGISAKNIEEHLKLYAGYVKHANLILEHIEELLPQSEKYAYELGELQRRFAFEFDGMRNHEYYFNAFEGGAKPLSQESAHARAVTEEWGSFDRFLARFKAIALTRGIGWAMLYYDPHTKRLLTQWVDEQHLGHLTGASPILALDMWEHAFVADYQPSGKKQYVEDFFSNLNWSVIEKNFIAATR
ncbi:MAG: superoxide dismutase, Fe-Mn family [Parcubacteria group bacterium Greene0416_79]|nr:MAG: superoxide dismutase, Fe-Mn family [Parcubacteria group bacterium Greene0416_79]